MKYKKLLFTLLGSLLCNICFSYDFKVDGLCYNVLSETERTVELTWEAYRLPYSGNITIPQTVTNNGVPYRVIKIGERAFANVIDEYGINGNNYLTSVTIPNSVTSIGESAFSICIGLTSVTIPNSVESIGTWAFFRCTGISSITIPNSVKSIGTYAFEDCSSLISILIPASVTSIGYGISSGCTNLQSICVEDGNKKYDSRDGGNAIIKKSNNELIAGCKNTVIPNSVTSIGNSAFRDCSGLTSITIPNSVTSIGSDAFYKCSGLTSITIPNSVTSIGEKAFYGTGWYEKQTDGLVYAGKVAYMYKGEMSQNTSIIIEEGTFGISGFAFDGCSGLSSITIPNSVTSIGNYAFYGCSSLTSVTMERNTPVEINASCFSNRKNATLRVPYGSKAAYATADYWKEFKEILEEQASSPNITFADSNVKALCVANWDKNGDGELSEAEAAAVTNLGEVFKNASITSFNELRFFTNLTSIGDYAFTDCYCLTSITIPNGVTSIRDYAFSYCSGLTSITIPNGVTSIGNSAFKGCSGLTSITIPNSVTSIESGAFSDCSALTSITIPNSVKSIGSGAFSYCSGLTSITVSSGNTKYDSRNNCNAIIEKSTNTLIVGCKNTVIPNSVTSIGYYAFSGCSGLNTVTIPNSVTSIGNYAFSGCNGLKDIISEIKNPFEIYEDVFSVYSTAQLTVPAGTKSAYQSTAGWNKFSNIVEYGAPNTYSLSITVSSGGSVTCSGNTISGTTKSFNVDEGTSATLTFTPDNGYRLSSVKVNNSDVTSSVKNNQYTISNINQNTTVNVVFESGSTSLSVASTTIYIGTTEAMVTASLVGESDSFVLIGVAYGTSMSDLTYSDTNDDNHQVSYEFAERVTFSFSNLAMNTTYYARVYIKDADGNYTEGETVSFQTKTKFPVPEYVDLGLPSGVRWAKWNMGSESELDVPNTVYARYGWGDPSGEIHTTGNDYRVSEYPIFALMPDHAKDISGTKYDIATVQWGDKWRLPTPDDFDELNEYNGYTTWEYGNYVDSKGNAYPAWKVTSVKYPDRYIYFPAAGLIKTNGAPDKVRDYAYYWVSTDNGYGSANYAQLTRTISFNPTEYGTQIPIRPVYGKPGEFTENNNNDDPNNDPNNDPTIKRTIHVATAGTLLNYISESEKYTIEELTLTGELNGTDFRLLRDMAGNNYLGQDTEGKLRKLDFSGAKIVAGGEKYLDTNSIEGNGVSAVGSFHYDVTNNNVVPQSVFFACNLEIVSISNTVTSIGVSAFSLCSGLTSITIPNSVTSIEYFAFEGCSGLTSVTIPNSVTSIGVSAFARCSGLTSITVSSGNAKYDSRNNCNAIIEKSTQTLIVGCKNTVIPNSVTSIGDGAFSGCSGLTSITIPNSVTSLENAAFFDCSGLKNVISEIKKPFAIYENVFTVYSTAKLTVPTGTKSAYQSTFGWNKFSNIVEYGEPTTYSLSITTSTGGSVTYAGNKISGTTKSFNVDEGASATLTFIPDNGYKLGSVIVNGTNVTSGVSNNQYTISNINQNTTVSVVFEAIPPTTYSLSISATGYGSASYNSTTVRNRTSLFTVNEGSSATITFIPDNGYRIKSVKVNGSTVTISNNKYTINNITTNTTVSVEFEVIPPTTYTLSITASGNGSASYVGTTVRSKTSSFTVNEGTSATITFTPDDGYRIGSVIVNGSDVTSSVSDNQYTISNISQNTTVEVEFEEIPPTTYSLNITAIGDGYVAYNGTIVRSKTTTFTVIEGASVILPIIPDTGHQIKSVKVNGNDVTSHVSNNAYTISNISQNTTVEVEFEEIPPTTYSLSITATGFGSVSYNSTTIRNKTSMFTSNEGTSATIKLTPDDGYCIGSIIVNGSDVTSSVTNNQYTISDISQNTTVEVTFEEIPPTTYSLNIAVTGNGYVAYDGTIVRSQTSTFTLIEGSSAILTIIPDTGHQIKSVKVNGNDVISDVSNNELTISDIRQNTTVEVEFEEIPPTTYSLTITSKGNGYASYDGNEVRSKTNTFTVIEGSSATITFVADDGYRIKSVKVNGTDVTSNLTNNLYTISNINGDTTVEVEFVEKLKRMTVEGLNYKVESYDDQTVKVEAGSYGRVLTVPASFDYEEKTWTVIGIEENALANSSELSAIMWKPNYAMTATVNNPNLLLYVESATYAPSSVKNVVVNGLASSITLTEAANGNDFYCPESFMAKTISFTHNYKMLTGIDECLGWETIALPFDVQTITHAEKGLIVPFATWNSGDAYRPFWLYEMTTNGWKEARAIRSNTPYIISMPNNPLYNSAACLNGKVTFSAEDVTVDKTEANTVYYNGKRFVPNFVNQSVNGEIYALNVRNDWENNAIYMKYGSEFVRNMRSVHPFEAYMTTTNGSRISFGIFEELSTEIRGVIDQLRNAGTVSVYNLNGQKIKAGDSATTVEDVKRSLPAGVYIIGGHKTIIKK